MLSSDHFVLEPSKTYAGDPPSSWVSKTRGVLSATAAISQLQISHTTVHLPGAVQRVQV